MVQAAKDCAAGEFSGVGEKCAPCPAGTIPNGDQSDCDACPDGQFSGAGATECTSCPPRHRSATIGGVTVCENCPDGEVVVSNVCEPVGEGKWQKDGSDDKQDCGAGFETRANGKFELTRATACVACPTGKYDNDGESKTACIDIP